MEKETTYRFDGISDFLQNGNFFEWLSSPILNFEKIVENIKEKVLSNSAFLVSSPQS